ncbi:MAG: sel1 repeat family protein [Planctomycetes bacterium]|nr:sel1 repeat family protein [Planctomycetota bacterium]
MSYPKQVQRLHDAIQGLAGVKEVEMSIRSLDGLGERELSFPGEFGDLPHLAIRRTKGGQAHELLVTAEIRFFQNFEGWIAVEFLAWWVRDLSRGGEHVQMRPLALPPVAYGTQLGRTLKFVIEFFFINPTEDNAPVLKVIGEHAKSLAESTEQYAKPLAHPTQAEHEDIDSLQRAAENGDASAQLALAQFLENGEGVDEDKDEAFKWYKRAAEHGHPEAKMRLGICYEYGTGVKVNHKKAFPLYQEAAEAGIPLAMGLLAGCYSEGRGVTKDQAQGVEWYRRGADSGEASCQAELGECYEYGKGVKRDLQEALKWYQMALEQEFDAVQPAIDRVKATRK